MKNEFKNKMNKLTDEEIVDFIDRTWNDPEGEIIREVGFDIIEDRCGYEYSDSVYVILWNKHRNND